VSVAAPGRRFVSRGGDKLAAALDAFDVDVAGRRALDAGCATGGFTDALLDTGAASVVAVDVAYGQFDWGLRNDARVQLHERTNVRALSLEVVGEPVSLIVADLAFIDLRKVRAAFEAVSTPDADAVLLVKPQFELPRSDVPRGGVVRASEAWRRALGLVVDGYAGPWGLLGACASPVVGPKGNREFFVWLQRGAASGDPAMLDRAVEEAP
jgi:23S rRNA (cytidine1920-2'-O)/16S rRNA (cytidine1409-2'-O)-methyltransferase